MPRKQYPKILTIELCKQLIAFTQFTFTIYFYDNYSCAF